MRDPAVLGDRVRLLVIDAAVAMLAYVAVRTARRWNTPAPPGQAGAVLRSHRRPGAVVSGLAEIGYLLVVVAGAVMFWFCPTLILALFLLPLLPEALPERQARLWVAGQLPECGHGTPAG